MHQSEGSPLMILTNSPSIIREGQVADEFHHFTIMYFPPLPLVGSPAEGEALGGRSQLPGARCSHWNKWWWSTRCCGWLFIPSEADENKSQRDVPALQVEPELPASAKSPRSREQGKTPLVHLSVWWAKIPGLLVRSPTLLNGCGDKSNPQCSASAWRS